MSVRPELYVHSTAFAISFEHTDLLKIVVTGKEVECRQRVEVLSLCRYVLVILNDIAGTYIQSQPIFQESGRIPDREIVAAITVIRQNTCRIGC